MITIDLVVLLLFIHWFADFFCQTDGMALNKSKSFKWLSIHSAVYSAPFFLFGVEYGIFMFITHMIIDGITSRVSAYLWKTEQRHWFFTNIGFDQWIHYVVMFCGWLYLGDKYVSVRFW